MFSFLFRKSQSEAIPHQLYGGLMAQSRMPFLYADFGVPDTVMGRFDMLALHTYLMARRLKADDSEIANSLSQDIFDLFVADIERALRELGIGDTTVPKRKKKMVRSFYGQIDDFDTAMNNHDASELAESAGRRYLTEGDGDADGLAAYMLSQEANLLNQPTKGILRAELSWDTVVPNA